MLSVVQMFRPFMKPKTHLPVRSRKRPPAPAYKEGISELPSTLSLSSLPSGGRHPMSLRGWLIKEVGRL